MNETMHLGPLVLPTAYLLLMASFVLADRTGALVARRQGTDIGRTVPYGLLAGLVCSRLWFVWQMRAVYAATPLDILDLRDGGWEPQAGFLAAWAWGLLRLRSRPGDRRPVLAALGVASATWILGSLLLLATARPGPALPALSLQGGGAAQSSSLADFRGKPTVVNLWATWCPPCQREMPVLQQAQARMPQVHFVFLNQGESSGTVDAFLARRHPGLRNVFLDPAGQAGTLYGDRALPTTLFFDARGRLVDRRVGELSAATLQRHLDGLAATIGP